MDTPTTDFARAGSLEELKAKGRLVVHGGHRPILVVHDRGRVFALDNRCPHMGFPLERGSVEDGILTCHWHHARFDLASGCTFDLWADDVPTCPVEVRDGEVWVKTTFGHADPAAHWRQRLDDGLAHDPRPCHRQGRARPACGRAYRAPTSCGRWRCSGRRTATAGAWVSRSLRRSPISCPCCRRRKPISPCSTARAASRQTATARRRGGNVRRLRSRPDLATLKRWLRRWTTVRHREAAERTLLTAIAAGASPAVLADALLAAETERAFADTGHSLDFINKAFECLDLIGWEHASGCAADCRRPDGGGPRRRRIDRTGASPSILLRCVRKRPASCRNCSLPAAACTAGRITRRSPERCSATIRPRIVDALKAAIRAGAAPADLGRSLAYAAALRVARFGNANEHADWETAHHVFTYANAIHQMLKRIGTADTDGHVTAVRGVLHGAMALYLARYLNVPPARIPGEGGEQLDDLPADAEMIRAALLDAFDRQRQVDLAARLVARHLTLGHSPQALIATLARARAARRCRLPRLSDAGGGSPAVHRMGQYRRGPAHPHCGCPLSCGPFADRTRGTADGRHRPAVDAGRRAASGGWSVVTTPANF